MRGAIRRDGHLAGLKRFYVFQPYEQLFKSPTGSTIHRTDADQYSLLRLTSCGGLQAADELPWISLGISEVALDVENIIYNARQNKHYDAAW